MEEGLQEDGNVSEAGPSHRAVESKSIFSYFGNGSSSAPKNIGENVVKSRRKKVEDTGSQAKIRLSNGTSWMLAKDEDSGVSDVDSVLAIANGQGRKKGKRKSGDDEIAELKEMDSRAKAAAKAMSRKGKRKSKECEDQAMGIMGNAIASTFETQRRSPLILSQLYLTCSWFLLRFPRRLRRHCQRRSIASWSQYIAYETEARQTSASA